MSPVAGLDGPGSNPGGDEFSARPDRPWGPLCTMGTGSFLGVKCPGRGIVQPPPSSAEVKEN